jgi:hypothetical protein
VSRRAASPKPPLRWTGIIFAFAMNVLLVTFTHSVIQALRLSLNSELLATVVAPLIAGAATAAYVRSRGGVHALIGSLLALPILGLYVFPSAWPLAIFAAAFCTMGGAAAELALRGRAESRPR